MFLKRFLPQFGKSIRFCGKKLSKLALLAGSQQTLCHGMVSATRVFFFFLFNPFPNMPWFLHVCDSSLSKTLGDEKIAHNEQFLLLPQCFFSILRTFFHFYQISNCRLQTLSLWKSLKICCLGKG